MTDFEKISHLIRFGLSFHKITLESVNDWANSKINEQPSDSLFFDIATAKTTNKVIELLYGTVSWNYNDKEIRSLILSYYKEYLNSNRHNWYQIEKELLDYFQLIEYENSNDRVEDFLYYLDNDWKLRKDGFAGPLIMPQYLTENLIQYNSYNNLKEFLTRQGLMGYDT